MSPSSTLSQELFKTEGKRPDLWLVQLVHERSECQFEAVKERLWASQQVVGPSLRGLRQEARPVCSATGVLHCSSTDMVLLPCRIEYLCQWFILTRYGYLAEQSIAFGYVQP